MGWLFDFGSMFSWQRLTSVPFEDEILGPLATIYLIIFIAGFLTSAVLYWRAPARFKASAPLRRLSQRSAAIFMWVTGVGLAFFGFRVLGLPFLGWRLWLWVSLLALLVAIGYVVWYARARYPAEREAFEAQQLKRRYQQPGRRPVAANGPEDSRSPRAEKRRQRSGSRNR